MSNSDWKETLPCTWTDCQTKSICACGHESGRHILHNATRKHIHCDDCTCKKFMPTLGSDMCDCGHDRQEHDGACKQQSCGCSKFDYDEESTDLNKRKIIHILDDDAEEADLNIRSVLDLRMPDVKVTISTDKEEFYKKELNQAADLIIVDVHLGDPTGIRGHKIIASKMMSLGVWVPVIVMSGKERALLEEIKEECEKDPFMSQWFKAFWWKGDKIAELVEIDVPRILEEFSGCKASIKAKRTQFGKHGLLDLPATELALGGATELGLTGLAEKDTVGTLLDWCEENCNSKDLDTSAEFSEIMIALDDKLRAYSLESHKGLEADDDE